MVRREGFRAQFEQVITDICEANPELQQLKKYLPARTTMHFKAFFKVSVCNGGHGCCQ